MLACRVMRREALGYGAGLFRGVASWSKFNPDTLSGSNPAQVSNLGGLVGVAPVPAVNLRQPGCLRARCLQCMARGCRARRA
jgi:hypothetical protein